MPLIQFVKTRAGLFVFFLFFPMPGLFSGEKGEKVCELFFFASKQAFFC
jgi:hypothetical protein